MNQTAEWTNPNLFPIEAGAWKVRSRSHPTAFHTVRETRNGRRCSCPATVARCQHIKDVEQMIEFHQMTESPLPVMDASDFDFDPFAGHPLETTPDVFAGASLAIACRGCDTRIVIEPGESLYCGGCTAVMGAPVPAMPVVPVIEGSCLWSDRTPFEVWASALDLFFADSIAA